MVSTMRKDEYIKEHIIWWFISYIWFRVLIFRCLPGCTYFQSFLLLLAMSVFVMGMGIVLTWDRERNYTNLVMHLSISWGVFVIVAYADFFKRQMAMIGIVVIVVSILLSTLILGRKIKGNDTCTRTLIMKKRVRNVICVWRRNLAVASLVMMVPIGVSMLFNGTVMSSNLEVAKVYGEEHSLSANMEIISNIAPERWKNLDMQTKLNVCQAIINAKAAEYGISHELLVGTADLSENTLASYCEQLHQITIDVDYLKWGYSYKLLESLIHECTHAYQYEQIDLYKKVDEESRNLLMFYEASVYLEEFSDYKDGNEDFELYYGQLAEINARKEGENGAEEYIRRIEEYLNEVEGAQGEYITMY